MITVTPKHEDSGSRRLACVGRRGAYALLLSFCVVLLLPTVSGASDSCGIREAVKRERSAHRTLVRAKAEYRQSRDVARQTKALTAKYGKNVGRWVWLAADVGWPRGTWGNLCSIIARESGGSPHATNPTSAASGLLQFMPQWYQGAWGYPAFDPYDPRANLKAGVWLYRHEGWSPWAL